MAGLDDTSSTPDLHDIAEVDAPFVLFISYVDDAYSLDVGGEAGAVDCETQVFNEGFLLGWRREGKF